jgi:hypothetical protein
MKGSRKNMHNKSKTKSNSKNNYKSKNTYKHTKTHKRVHKHTKYCKHSLTRRKQFKIKKSYKGGYGLRAGPVGFAWKGENIGTWPGVAGVPGQSNFLPLSENGVPAGFIDPPISTRNNLYGGGLTDLIPQDLVNFGRSLTGGIQGTVYGYQGVDRPYSSYSSPTEQPGIDANYKYINSNPPDINKIHQDAGKTVATI